jgi:hypothetical protein
MEEPSRSCHGEGHVRWALFQGQPIGSFRGTEDGTCAWSGPDIREVIADVNPVLRGWGNYFRTGNAAAKFRQADDYVVHRLRSLMVKKRGRNLHAGQARQWDEDWFNGHGLHRLRGTIRYPKAA